MTFPASNIKLNVDIEIDSPFFDSPGSFLKTSVTELLSGSINNPAALRIGSKVDRITASPKNVEITDTGGVKIGLATLLGENTTVADYDSGRDGINVIDLVHFGRMNSPLVSVNRESFLNKKNQINHVSSFNNFGISKLFKTYDNVSKTAIPFEDFPGILDPVAFVESGDYILQYMIVTDLSRNIDKFIDPDDLNGVIEVFDVRNSFANTSISDIEIKGIKASLCNENFFSIGQGSSPIDSKYEINQSSYSVYEDSQDVLYGGVTFAPRAGYSLSGSFAQESPVADENRQMSPFVESSNSLKSLFSDRLRDFIGDVYTGSLENEKNIPELGTRFRSSNTGFIGSPMYDIIANSRFINPGTDSIAFISTNRN